MDASENLSPKNQCERSIDATRERRYYIPVADGTAKLSGREHEFREPTLRREQLVRSEDLEGFQPTETKDNAEARRDFWSIQGDFIYRHHIEPRVQLYAEGRNIPYFTETH